MKITQVEALYLRLPEITDRADGTQDTLIVRVHTDAGLIGIGEVDSSPLVAKAIILSLVPKIGNPHWRLTMSMADGTHNPQG